MRSGILVSGLIAAVLLSVQPAGAMDDGVITINPDGSYAVSNETAKKAPATAAPATAVKEPIVSPLEIEKTKPVPVKKKPVVKKDQPVKTPVKKKEKKKAVVKEPEQSAPPELPPAGPIDRNQALRAAIQVAPPFRKADIHPFADNGKLIYQVILQTENGEQSIFVDGDTGEIMKRK